MEILHSVQDDSAGERNAQAPLRLLGKDLCVVPHEE